MQQLTLFNYADLDSETRIVVQQKTEEIKVLVRRTSQDIVDIGQKLTDIKARLGHGHFGSWLKAEFEWSERTAQRFMQVGEAFKNVTMSGLEIHTKALYLLSSANTAEEAREEALERAKSGETITETTAKRIIEESEPIAIADPVEMNEDNYADLMLGNPELEPENLPVIHPIAESNARPKKLPQELLAKTKAAAEAEKAEPNRFTAMEKSSRTDEHPTPDKITQYLYEFWPDGIDLDPCSDSGKNIKAAMHYTAEDDGLNKYWLAQKIYINPPFSDVGAWGEKAINYHLEYPDTEIIFLSKFDSRVGWFKPLMNACALFCVVEGYVSFEGNDGNAATFTTVLWYFGNRKAEFHQVFSQLGWVCDRVDSQPQTPKFESISLDDIPTSALALIAKQKKIRNADRLNRTQLIEKLEALQ